MGGRGTKFGKKTVAQLARELAAGGGGGASAMQSKPAGGGGGGYPSSDELNKLFEDSDFTTEGSGRAGTARKTLDYLKNYDPDGKKVLARTSDFKKQFKGRMPKLTAEELEAVNTYVGVDYTNINMLLRGRFNENNEAVLRNGTVVRITANDREKYLKTAEIVNRLVSSRLSKDTVVYRGTNISDPKLYKQATTIGAEVEIKGFASMSLSSRVARRFTESSQPTGVIYDVLMRKGTRVLPVDLARDSIYEHEVLPRLNTRVRVIRKLRAARTTYFSGSAKKVRYVPRFLVEVIDD